MTAGDARAWSNAHSTAARNACRTFSSASAVRLKLGRMRLSSEGMFAPGTASLMRRRSSSGTRLGRTVGRPRAGWRRKVARTDQPGLASLKQQEADRYRKAADNVLQHLDWSIGYLHGIRTLKSRAPWPVTALTSGVSS